jgi:hypothetical protein
MHRRDQRTVCLRIYPPIQIGYPGMTIDHKEQTTSATTDSEKSKGISQTLVLSALAGISILIGFVLYYWPVSQALQVNDYQSASCTLLAKKLETVTTNGGEDAYHPTFTFSVPARDGKNYVARGYGLIESSSGDRNAEQALLDSYKVNSRYPCWYDAGNPTDAVLNRDLDAMAFAPGTIFLSGGLILLFIAFARRPRSLLK